MNNMQKCILALAKHTNIPTIEIIIIIRDSENREDLLERIYSRVLNYTVEKTDRPVEQEEERLTEADFSCTDFECPKCNQRKSYCVTKQTRSIDEPISIFYFCICECLL
jgi:DNA-directed RNA polymerase subunit M/transcription elongation factor TFIIS